MEAYYAVEKKRPIRETAAQKLARQSADFVAGMTRMVILAILLLPFLLAAFLTLDLPVRALDRLFASDIAARPSNWLSRGGLIMALTPLLTILFARRVGGDEASRVITATWGVAALAVFAELSYLAPALEQGDFPSVRFTMVFVASAMAAQYIAVNVYDVARGGDSWWRAPFYGAIGGFLFYDLIYFPGVYLGSRTPWFNWMIADLGIKLVLAFAFIGVYGFFRKSLKPKGGFGGF